MNTSLCIRCGKQRIVKKTWSEKVNNSLITYTLTVCPDAECQKIVDDQFQKKREKIESIQKESLRRRMQVKRTKKRGAAGR